MKTKKILTKAILAIAGVAFICACVKPLSDLVRDNPRDPDGDNWHPGVITVGAFNYNGTYPAPDTLSYVDKFGQGRQVYAYPGQVQVFTDPGAADTIIAELVEACGGTIIGQVPSLGYYLASVAAGTESAFISAVNADPDVRFAIPNCLLQLTEVDLSDLEGPNGELPAVPNIKALAGNGLYLYTPDDYVNASGTGSLSCSGYSIPHGRGTNYIASRNLSGAGQQMNIFDAAGSTARPNDIASANALAFQDMTFNGTGRAVINYSLQGAYEDANHNPLPAAQYRANEVALLWSYAAQLDALATASPATFNKTVVIVSSGNGVGNNGTNGLDLTSEIQQLRTAFPRVFSTGPGTHMIIVGGTQLNSTAVDRGFNYSNNNGDMVYAPSHQVQVDGSGCTANGTSFAAPEVTNLIAGALAANADATVGEVTQAFMKAYADNGYALPTASQIAGALCRYSISPGSGAFGPDAGSGCVTVSVNGSSGCTWTAVSGAGWITITSGSSGSGDGTVAYSVAAAVGVGQRTGTISIAGRTFTVTQHSADWCTYTVSPASQSFDVDGGSGVVIVTSESGCPWTAASSESWISVNAVDSGNGNGTVDFSVAPNTTFSPRTGSMTIAGRTFTVSQESCTYSIAPTGQSFGAGGGSGSMTVTAGSTCTWDAISGAGWITVTSGATGTGSGAVGFSVQANLLPSQRSGTITVADNNIFTITQSGRVGGVTLYDGYYTGTYSGTATVLGYSSPVSGPVAMTVSNGLITLSEPGTGSGTVAASGSTSFSGSGVVDDATCSFNGTFVESSGTASASGYWSATFTDGTASGTWSATRQ